MKKTRRKSLYDFRGFTGPDNSIWTSLFEYGIAWKEVKKDEYVFVTGIHIDDYSYDRFTYSWYSKKEFSEMCAEPWFNIEGVSKVCGTSRELFIEGFPYSIHEAMSYHGYENIFGSTYHDGFEILGSS